MDDRWRKIAADMIEAGRLRIDGSADSHTVRAAAFVFDQGVFFLPAEARTEIVKMLRQEPLT